MANCNECVKINSLPGCIDTVEFQAYGLTFPDYASSTLTAYIQNLSTGKYWFIYFDTDVSGNVISFDIAEIFPLSDHVYKINFLASNGTPANFLLTNPDTTTAEGCCIEFGILEGLIGTDGFFLSNQGCAVDSTATWSSPLTLDDVADSASRAAVTPAQAASFPVGASSLNKLALQSDLTASFAPYVTPQQYGSLGTSSTFASLGITQPTIDATYPGVGALTTDTVDWAALEYGLNQSYTLNKPFFTSGIYYINRGLTLQPTRYKSMWAWIGGGAELRTTNNNAFTVFTLGTPSQQSSVVAVATDAMWLVNNTYHVSELNVTAGTAQTRFRFGPSYSSRFDQLLVEGANIGIRAEFNLNATISNCNMRECLYSFRLQSGNTFWTNATTSNSQCNHTIFNNCRVSWQSNVNDAEIGFDIIDSSGTAVLDCIVEGTRVRKGISLYSQLTTVYTFRAVNYHYECASGTLDAGNNQAAFWSRTLGGLLVLDSCYGQYGAILADTGLSAGGGSVTLKLQNTYFWVAKSARAFQNNGNTSYVFTDNDNPFKTKTDVIALTAGTAISECGGDGCGNNKFYLYGLPR